MGLVDRRDLGPPLEGVRERLDPLRAQPLELLPALGEEVRAVALAVRRCDSSSAPPCGGEPNARRSTPRATAG